MTIAQRCARLATTIAVSQPRLWRVLRAPFRRYFDVLAPRWDRIIAQRDLDALVAALADLPAPRRVLDVGTGTGAAAFAVAARFPGAEVTGVDLSPAMVAIARANTPANARVQFVVGDASQLPVADSSCELVTLANAIPFFDELARVVAPGGTVLVSFSEGAETPIWVPPGRLREELGTRGFDRFSEIVIGEATCLAARRTVDPYGSCADEYARVVEPMLAPVLRRLVEVAHIGPESHVLDLATGTGAAARTAAVRGAAVTGVDLSQGMIDAARRCSTGIRFDVADGAALPYPDGAFSAVTCGFALSHFPNVAAVLDEVLRVLEPGGVFAACSWGVDASNPAASAVRSSLPEAAPNGLDEETWADEERAAAVLRAAGFVAVETCCETFAGRFADADDAIDWTLAWPSALEQLASLDADARRTFIDRARAAIDDLAWRYAVGFHLGRAGRARPTHV